MVGHLSMEIPGQFRVEINTNRLASETSNPPYFDFQA